MADSAPELTIQFIVSGAVQGVGYRYFVLHRAGVLGVAGWAKNLPDGRVEVLAQGTSESLAALESALRQGPPHARVSGVERTQISDEIYIPKPFEIR
jgi:acylphosphatase